MEAPEDLELTPLWVMHSLVYSVDEFDALGRSLERLLKATASSSYYVHRADDVRQWVRKCVDSYSEAMRPLTIDFRELPESIRPAFLGSVSANLTKHTPSFLSFTMMTSLSERFLSEFRALHQPYETQFELHGNPLRSGFSIEVKTCMMRRPEEAQSLLETLDSELRRVLEYYHFPGDQQDKLLTRAIVYSIQKECWWWDDPPRPTPEDLHTTIPELHLTYIQSLGDMLGSPSYIGSSMSLAINDFRRECTPRAYTFYINSSVLPEYSEEDWQLTEGNDTLDSLMNWRSVQAYLNLLNHLKMKAHRIRSALHTSCSMGVIRTRHLGKFIKELSEAQYIALALNTLHADLIDHCRFEYYIKAPTADMLYIRPGGGSSLRENIKNSASRLSEPVIKMLSVSVSTATQYLNGQYLETNRRLQRALVFLSVALLVLGAIQLILIA